MGPSDVIDLARSLVDLALNLVPDDQVTQFISEAGIRRANMAADVAEAAKFLGDPFGDDRHKRGED